MRCIRIVDSKYQEGEIVTVAFGEGAFHRKADVPVQTYALVPDALAEALDGFVAFVSYPMSYAPEAVVPLLDGEEDFHEPPPPPEPLPSEIPSPALPAPEPEPEPSPAATGEFPLTGDEPTGSQVVVETKVLPLPEQPED